MADPRHPAEDWAKLLEAVWPSIRRRIQPARRRPGGDGEAPPAPPNVRVAELSISTTAHDRKEVGLALVDAGPDEGAAAELYAWARSTLPDLPTPFVGRLHMRLYELPDLHEVVRWVGRVAVGEVRGPASGEDTGEGDEGTSG